MSSRAARPSPEKLPVNLRAHLQAEIGRLANLDDGAVDKFVRYCDLLNYWNRRINLTSLDLNPPSKEALDRLFIEPLLAVRHVGTPTHWIDIGSGGGSPAIPMKISRPS